MLGKMVAVALPAVGMTSKVTAAGRAVESGRPDRLFDDPLAAALAGPDGFRWMAEWRLPGMPAENPTIGPRTRFFDDLVTGALDGGLDQVVLVAAGMDSRAFRLALPSDAVVLELDLGAVLAAKQAVLDQVGARPQCRRIAVVADLDDDAWPGALTRAGFNASRPAVFLAEGLSCYLTKDRNARLLDHLASLAAPRSILGIDMLSSDYLENPAVAPFLKLLAARGIRWQFGTNDPAAFLATHGWLAQVHSFDEVRRGFGRWPPPGVSEDVAARAAAASRNWYINADRATGQAPGGQPDGPRL
jgi:methyltransferase (TIGR00027 family)